MKEGKRHEFCRFELKQARRDFNFKKKIEILGDYVTIEGKTAIIHSGCCKWSKKAHYILEYGKSGRSEKEDKFLCRNDGNTTGKEGDASPIQVEQVSSSENLPDEKIMEELWKRITDKCVYMTGGRYECFVCEEVAFPIAEHFRIRHPDILSNLIIKETRKECEKGFNKLFDYWAKAFFSSTYQNLLKERIQLLDTTVINKRIEQIRVNERKKMIWEIEKFVRTRSIVTSEDADKARVWSDGADWFKSKILDELENLKKGSEDRCQ